MFGKTLIFVSLFVGGPADLNAPPLQYYTGLFCLKQTEIVTFAEMVTQKASPTAIMREVNKDANSVECSFSINMALDARKTVFKENVHWKGFERGIYQAVAYGQKTKAGLESYPSEYPLFILGTPQ